MLREIAAKVYRSLPGIRELLQIRGDIHGFMSVLRADLRSFQAIGLLDFRLEHHPRYGDPRRLFRYQSQVCSQNGEDGVLHEIFRRVGTTNRIFAEVGVGSGSENNTAFLLTQGWSGYWIDGSSNFLTAIRDRVDLGSGCLKWLVTRVSRENIAACFERLGVPREFDLLSLDIDQNTYYAWESLGLFNPRVVVVEYNSAVPADLDWKVHYHPDHAWNGSQNFGASLKAFETLGRRLGYRLVGCEFVGVNAFFVRADLVGDKFSEPFTSENHYEPPRYALAHRRGHVSTILDRATRKET